MSKTQSMTGALRNEVRLAKVSQLSDALRIVVHNSKMGTSTKTEERAVIAVAEALIDGKLTHEEKQLIMGALG
jgi:hypothetical protein